MAFCVKLDLSPLHWTSNCALFTCRLRRIAQPTCCRVGILIVRLRRAFVDSRCFPILLRSFCRQTCLTFIIFNYFSVLDHELKQLRQDLKATCKAAFAAGTQKNNCTQWRTYFLFGLYVSLDCLQAWWIQFVCF